jgi:hypothetical protein
VELNLSLLLGTISIFKANTLKLHKDSLNRNIFRGITQPQSELFKKAKIAITELCIELVCHANGNVDARSMRESKCRRRKPKRN